MEKNNLEKLADLLQKTLSSFMKMNRGEQLIFLENLSNEDSADSKQMAKFLELFTHKETATA